MKPQQRLVAAWVAVMLLRLVAAARAPLSGDEAYYWLWSRHLAWGYYDHPPMVAWLLALPGFFGLQHPFWLRLPFVLLGSIVPWVWNRVALGVGASEEGVRLTTWFVLFMPYLGVEATTATPNIPVLAFLSLAVWWTGYAVWTSAGTVGAARAGVYLGLAILSKFTALLWAPSLLGLLWLRTRIKAVILAGCTVAVLLPYLVWNATHAWEPFQYQLQSRHAIEHKALGLGTFLLMQALAASPLLFVAAIGAIRQVGRARCTGLWLLSMALLPLALFGVAATREYVEIYWPLQAWRAFAVLVAWQMHPPRWLVVAILAPGIFVSALLYGGSAVPGVWVRLASVGTRADFPGNDVTEFQAYAPLGADLKQETGMVMTDHYGLSSVLWYYSGRPTWTLPISLRGREFQRWEDPMTARGQDAVYVDRSPLSQRGDVAAMLAASFDHVGPCVPVRYVCDGVTARVFYETRCYGFRGAFTGNRVKSSNNSVTHRRGAHTILGSVQNGERCGIP